MFGNLDFTSLDKAQRVRIAYGLTGARIVRSHSSQLDMMSATSTVAIVEGKSIPTSIARKRLRCRFGYILAILLIGAGSLMNLKLILPTFALATVVSLSVVGIAVLVQMPVHFLQSRERKKHHFASDQAARN